MEIDPLMMDNPYIGFIYYILYYDPIIVNEIIIYIR